VQLQGRIDVDPSARQAGRRNEKRQVRGRKRERKKSVRGAWDEIMAWLPRWWWIASTHGASSATQFTRAEAGPHTAHMSAVRGVAVFGLGFTERLSL
jgi:hypothetical protein